VGSGNIPARNDPEIGRVCVCVSAGVRSKRTPDFSMLARGCRSGFQGMHYIHYVHYGMSGFGKGRNPYGPRLKAGGARLEMSHKDDPYMS